MRFRELCEGYMRERFRADEAKKARQRALSDPANWASGWEPCNPHLKQYPPEVMHHHQTFHLHSRKAASFKRRAYAMLRGSAPTKLHIRHENMDLRNRVAELEKQVQRAKHRKARGLGR